MCGAETERLKQHQRGSAVRYHEDEEPATSDGRGEFSALRNMWWIGKFVTKW